MEHLPTHTWRGRNGKAITNLVQLLGSQEVTNLRIIDIGPGGLAKPFASYFPEGDQSELSGIDKVRKKLANAMESGARDKEDVDLICYEVPEIYSAFSKIGIGEFFAVDKFKKVRDCVDKLNLPNVRTLDCDIETKRILHNGSPLTGKAVIALHVLQRCEKDKAYALQTILDAVEQDGYLLINLPSNFDISSRGFINARTEKDNDYQIYTKINSIAKQKKIRYSFRAPSLDYDQIARIASSSSAGK